LQYPIYVIFDADKTERDGEITNKKLTTILFTNEESFPMTKVEHKGAVFEENIEEELKKEILTFEELKKEAKQIYGLKGDRNKEIIAKYIADKTNCPEVIKEILSKIRKL